MVKRAFDVVLSGLGLLASAPLWALIALLVKLGDGGPVFYAQERVGRDGRRFQSLNSGRWSPMPSEGSGRSRRATPRRGSPGWGAGCGPRPWTSCPSSGAPSAAT